MIRSARSTAALSAFLTCCTMCALCSVGTRPAAASEWNWSLTPYGWLASVGADVSVNDQDFVSGGVDFGDIVDKLDFGFALDFQGRRGRHGFVVDVTIADGKDHEKRRPFRGPAGTELVTKGDLEEILLDVGGLYNPRGDGWGWSLIYGARIMDLSQDIEARIETPGQVSESRRYVVGKTAVDGLVGVRYIGHMSERWLFNFRGDVSTGDSEFNLNGLAGVGYIFGQSRRHAILGGYRYLKIERDERDGVAEIESRLGMSGPYVAVTIGF